MESTPLRSDSLSDLMTEKEWAEYTGLSAPTLRRQRYEGGGAPFIKIGNSVRYPRDRALAWLDALQSS